MSKTSQRSVSRKSDIKKLYEQGIFDGATYFYPRWIRHPHLRAYTAGWHKGQRSLSREKRDLVSRVMGMTND
jgi:hypothetical protein